MTTATNVEPSLPRDVAAIFHVSFHPTQGNTVDWCLPAPGWEDLKPETLGLEFSALPSGLHQVDEDIVYFTTAIQTTTTATPKLLHALSLFRRRRTPNSLYRGFLLSALGVLVTPSYPDGTTLPEGSDAAGGIRKPRPWRHVETLKDVAERCYSRPGSDPSATPATGVLVDVEASSSSADELWYSPAQDFLNERGVRSLSMGDFLSDNSVTLGGDSVDDLRIEDALSSSHDREHIPTLQLPGLLSLLGPSSVTLFKYLLARKRIMVYTNPAVGPACTMCYAMVDMIQAIQTKATPQEDVAVPARHTEPVRVLGMLTLHDLVNDNKRLIVEDKADQGRGWVACTTDALFLERPQYYDVMIDLTALPVHSSLSSSSSTASIYHTPSGGVGHGVPLEGNGKKPSNLASNRPRPTFYVSKAANGSGSRPSFKLSQTKWAWSDARLWTEVDRVLRIGAEDPTSLADPSFLTEYNNASSSSSSTSSEPRTPQPIPSQVGSSSVASTSTKAKKRKGKSKSRERRSSQSTTTGRSSEAESSQGPDGAPQLTRIPTTIPTTLSDAWKVYEDVCLVCAGMWMGTLSSRAAAAAIGGVQHGLPGHSPSSTCQGCYPTATPTLPGGYPSGLTQVRSISRTGTTTGVSLKLEGDDDVLLRTIRGTGKMREVSTSSHVTAVSGTETLVAIEPSTSSSSSKPEAGRRASVLSTSDAKPNPQTIVALAVLNTLDRYADWQIGVLRAYVKSLVSDPSMKQGGGERGSAPPPTADGVLRLTLTPRDLVLLDLNPLSSGDVKYLEAVAKEYAGHVVVHVVELDDGDLSRPISGVDDVEEPYVQVRKKKEKVNDMNVDLVVKRGWKELVAVVFGFV